MCGERIGTGGAWDWGRRIGEMRMPSRRGGMRWRLIDGHMRTGGQLALRADLHGFARAGDAGLGVAEPAAAGVHLAGDGPKNAVHGFAAIFGRIETVLDAVAVAGAAVPVLRFVERADVA